MYGTSSISIIWQEQHKIFSAEPNRLDIGGREWPIWTSLWAVFDVCFDAITWTNEKSISIKVSLGGALWFVHEDSSAIEEKLNLIAHLMPTQHDRFQFVEAELFMGWISSRFQPRRSRLSELTGLRPTESPKLYAITLSLDFDSGKIPFLVNCPIRSDSARRERKAEMSCHECLQVHHRLITK